MGAIFVIGAPLLAGTNAGVPEWIRFHKRGFFLQDQVVRSKPGTSSIFCFLSWEPFFHRTTPSFILFHIQKSLSRGLQNYKLNKPLFCTVSSLSDFVVATQNRGKQVSKEELNVRDGRWISDEDQGSQHCPQIVSHSLPGDL
jgi:hypothetical protein